ncbi:MAG TPA: hypothetical protein VFO69_12390 [Allosphingosinicella sp.]|nr:hypothetical protein [Allosphingosinicella sp.]
MRVNGWLLAGGLLSALAALLHIAIIFGGPEYYRFFGAGEAMARAAERGSARPTLITAGIAGILFVWSAYAFSGAGLIRRLPWLRTGLITISAIYLARGLVAVPILFIRPGLADLFLLWSSMIVMGFGLVYAIGTGTAWSEMSPRVSRK